MHVRGALRFRAANDHPLFHVIADGDDRPCGGSLVLDHRDDRKSGEEGNGTAGARRSRIVVVIETAPDESVNLHAAIRLSS